MDIQSLDTSPAITQPEISQCDLFGETKRCAECSVIKPADMFRLFGKRGKPKYTAGKCKECTYKHRMVKMTAMTPEQRKKEWKHRSEYERTTLAGRAKSLYNNARSRALAKNKEVIIDATFILEKLNVGECAATGFKFEIGFSGGRGKIAPFSPSLDCIEPTEGYTMGNTQVVCSMYNIGKNKHAELDFKAMCMAVALRNMNDSAVHSRMHELSARPTATPCPPATLMLPSRP